MANLEKIKAIEDSFNRGYAPGGIPLAIDRRLKGLHPSETPERHLETIMRGYCEGRYGVMIEQAIDKKGTK